MRVNAAQHVSAVLTSKQSPRGQGGYQTLFYTPELVTLDEIRVIGQQTQYGVAHEEKPRWQSYQLSPGRHVVSRINPIPEPDEFGRRGRFIAHSFIFDIPIGASLDEILFSLLRPSRFLSTVDDVLASVGLKTGHIAPVLLDARNLWLKEARSMAELWSGEELNKFYILMRDPLRLTEQGSYVGLFGSEEDIVAALMVAFLLTPSNAQRFCSFDSEASEGGEPRITFWGRGVAELNGSVYAIDAANRRISILESTGLATDCLSLESVALPLREAILNHLKRPTEQMLNDLLNRRYGAFIAEPIYRALLGEDDLRISAADEELLARFSQAHSGLALQVALKTGNDSKRLQTLAAMDAASYKERLKELRTRSDFRPSQMFSPVFMPTWFDLLRGTYSFDDITLSVAAVANHGSSQDREYIERIHEYLDREELQKLSDWLKSSSLNFRDLQLALDRSASAGRGYVTKSLWGRLAYPFRR